MSGPILLLPHGAPDSIARGLAASAPARDELVAVLIPLPEANATAVLLRDLHGQPAALDLVEVATRMSSGGFEVGLADGSPDEPDRAWTSFKDGRVELRLGPRDEPWLPMDEDGFPDLDAPRRFLDQGIPAGHGRFRSCHDLGMTQVFSCRYGPVDWTLKRASAGEDVGAQAYLLSSGGHKSGAPMRLPWTGAGRPR